MSVAGPGARGRQVAAHGMSHEMDFAKSDHIVLMNIVFFTMTEYISLTGCAWVFLKTTVPRIIICDVFFCVNI